MNDGTLEELDAFVGQVLDAADSVTRLLPAGSCSGLTVIAVLLAVFGTIHFTQPALVRAPRGTRSATSEIVLGHARNYHLDPALLAAVIYQESKFDADARSDRGAIGLMQLLPETAKGIAARTGGSKFRVSDLVRPGDQRPLRRVVPAPPARQVRLRAARARRLQRGPGERRPLARARLPIQFEETRDFVDRVESLKKTYRHAYASLRQQNDT